MKVQILALSFGQVIDVLIGANGLNPSRRETLISRVKQWQKTGFPALPKVGKGTRAAYDADHLFQLAFQLRLLELGLTPERSQKIITAGWEAIRPSLAMTLGMICDQVRGTIYFVIAYDALTDLREEAATHDHVFVRPTPSWMIEEALSGDANEDFSPEERAMAESISSAVLADLRGAILVDAGELLISHFRAMHDAQLSPASIQPHIGKWIDELKAQHDELSGDQAAEATPLPLTSGSSTADSDFCAVCFARSVAGLEGHEEEHVNP